MSHIYVVQVDIMVIGKITKTRILGVASTEEGIRKVIYNYVLSTYNLPFNEKLQKLGHSAKVCNYYTINIAYENDLLRFYAEAYTVDE